MADMELDMVADKGVDKVADMVARTISLFGKGLMFDLIQFSITATTCDNIDNVLYNDVNVCSFTTCDNVTHVTVFK